MSNIIFCLHDEPSKIAFEQKLRKLMCKYKMVSYSDMKRYLDGEYVLQNSCHLTCDDGWLSTYHNVMPIIKKYNVPISVFVSPDRCRNGKNYWFNALDILDKEHIKTQIFNRGLFKKEAMFYPVEMLLKALKIEQIEEILTECAKNDGVSLEGRNIINIHELRDMDSSGLVNFGAHTINHPILANETDEVCLSEIRNSVIELEDILQKKVTSFAYPNGVKVLDFGSREMSILEECGITDAVTLENGFVKQGCNRLCLPRFTSFRRLSFGLLAPYMPSVLNQKGKRNVINKLKYD